jgi:hypothetical protein
MKGILKTTLFGAALAVAGAGFAQSSTSPQKGDEDRTPVSSPSATSPSTDTNSSGSMNATPGSATTSRTDTYSTSTSVTTPGTYSGTVKTIDTGHTVVITTADGRMQTFDVSSSPALAASVAVGSRVRVKQTVDANGKTVVTVEPYR